MEYIQLHVPFLRLPVIREIAEWLVGKIIEILVNKTELGLFFIYVDSITDEQRRKLNEAATKNKEAQASGSEDDRRLAEAELIAAARNLLRFNR